MTTHTHQHHHPDHPDGVVHEAGQPPSGGPVVLDIGKDVGALIVQLDPGLVGTELHVRQPGRDHTTHTGVWERELGQHRAVVAIFPALTEGPYAILDGGGDPVCDVAILGGQVTERDLRAS
jgi:hypothetical protein